MAEKAYNQESNANLIVREQRESQLIHTEEAETERTGSGLSYKASNPTSTNILHPARLYLLNLL